MEEKTIDVAKLMRDLQAGEAPAGDGKAQAAPQADLLAAHKQELERLLRHVQGTREQAAAHSEIGAALPGGWRGALARLVRRVSMFHIRPQTVVNHNLTAAAQGLADSDMALLRAVDTLRAEGVGALQERLDLMENHLVPLAHSLSAQNAALAREVEALQARLAALEENGKGGGA